MRPIRGIAREDLPHLGLARDHFLVLGLEQPEHGVVDVVDHLVDDLVQPDLDVLVRGQLPATCGRAGR